MHKVSLEKPRFTQKAANFFGVLGYTSLLFEWAWAIGIAAAPFLSIDFIKSCIPKNESPHPSVTVDPMLGLIVMAIATILCIGLTVYALYFIPRTIGKAGATITRTTTAAILPVIAKEKKISKKQKKRLSGRVMSLLKLGAILLPLASIPFLPEIGGMTRQVSGIVVMFFAACALVNFAVQAVIAKTAKIDTQKIW